MHKAENNEIVAIIATMARTKQTEDLASKIPRPKVGDYKSSLLIWQIIEKYGPITGPDTIPFTTPDADCVNTSMQIYFRRTLKFEPVSEDEVRKIYFNKHFSWWCPTTKTISEIVDVVTEIDATKTILEVGCGRGMAAKLLMDAGLQVYATEPVVENICTFLRPDHITAEAAIEKYNTKTLLIAYPPQKGHHGEQMCNYCVKKFRGVQIIYVGEPHGGCTGNDEFFAELANWKLYKKIALRRWTGIGDAVYVYRRG